VHWSQEIPGGALFYVSNWKTSKEIASNAKLNVGDEQLRDNVRANCAAGWQRAVPHPTNDLEVAILGGGPSLASQLDTLRDLRERGVKLVTVNGTYSWAREHGLWPVTQIMVDARQFNARFVDPPDPACLYLIASQCHPDVLAHLPRERTYLWHTGIETIEDILEAQWPGEPVYHIPSCSTAVLTGIILLRTLGYRQFHLFGVDSCLEGTDTHHAYVQPENDGFPVIPVMVTGGRVFYCHQWMIGQAQSFMDLIRGLGNEIELEVYGDGLLAHMLEAGASFEELEVGT
jgi:hypothetical protein